MRKRHIPFYICLLAAVCLFFALTQSSGFTTHPLGQSYVTASDDAEFLWPVPTSKTITSLFGNRKIAIYGRERMHTGIDIHAATDVDVLATQSGTVLVSTFDDGWGEYIIINHGDNTLSLYAHMHARAVKRGETVERGQRIGWVGNSGISEAPHLHFELRKSGKPINPLQFNYSDE